MLTSPQWVCDKNAGLYAAQAISAALYSRAIGEDGTGSVVDISMLEAGVSYGWIDQHGDQVIVDPLLPMPNIAAVYRPWQTADGWIVVVMLSQAEFEGWARAIASGYAERSSPLLFEVSGERRRGGISKR